MAPGPPGLTFRTAKEEKTDIEPYRPEATVAVVASSANRTYRSSLEVTVCPYAIFMMLPAVNWGRSNSMSAPIANANIAYPFGKSV